MIDYDLLVVGAGSGNMLPHDAVEGRRVAIIERDRFGGTCLNRGCIPSKMLVHTADVAETVRTAGRFGVHAELVDVDWPAIRDRIFGRIDPLSEEADRDPASKWRRRVPGRGSFRGSPGARGQLASSFAVSAWCSRSARARSSPRSQA